MEDQLLIRGIERIIIVIAGIVSLYLGYSLFIKGVSGEASLHVEHNKTKIQLLNAAPGLFFAALGCVILVYSILNNITYYSLNTGNNNKEISNRELIIGNQDFDNIYMLKLKNSLQKLNEKNNENDAIIMYYAGHGISVETEKSLWAVAQNKNTVQVYANYLSAYPKGNYTEKAVQRLNEIFNRENENNK